MLRGIKERRGRRDMCRYMGRNNRYVGCVEHDILFFYLFQILLDYFFNRVGCHLLTLHNGGTDRDVLMS